MTKAYATLLKGGTAGIGDVILQLVDQAFEVFAENPTLTPLEMTVKGFYIRGCVHLTQGYLATAEAYLRASYAGLTRLTGAEYASPFGPPPPPCRFSVAGLTPPAGWC